MSKENISVSDRLSIKIIRGDGSVEENVGIPKVTEEFLRHLLEKEELKNGLDETGRN